MYKKDNLRALAIAIGVFDKGTNAELIARIEGHFEQHPDLKHNSRFLGLFNKFIHVAPSQIEEEAQSLWWRAHSWFLVIMKDNNDNKRMNVSRNVFSTTSHTAIPSTLHPQLPLPAPTIIFISTDSTYQATLILMLIQMQSYPQTFTLLSHIILVLFNHILITVLPSSITYD